MINIGNEVGKELLELMYGPSEEHRKEIVSTNKKGKFAVIMMWRKEKMMGAETQKEAEETWMRMPKKECVTR